MYSTYITVLGDTWDGVAYKTLESEMYMDSLIKLNLKHKHIVIFPAGITLLIPQKTEATPRQVPPWKRGIL